MSSNSPECPKQEKSEARQAVEQQIDQKYGRLKWFQRCVGAASLLVGLASGYLDNKAVASGDLDVPAMLISTPVVVAASGATALGRRRTRRSSDDLITEYAHTIGVEADLRNYNAEIDTRHGRPPVRFLHDPATVQGEIYDGSHLKAIRFAPFARDICAFAGGFGLNGYSGDFHIPPEFAGHTGTLGVAGVGAGAICQMLEEASIGAHLRSYEAQLNNLDAVNPFRDLT